MERCFESLRNPLIWLAIFILLIASLSLTLGRGFSFNVKHGEMQLEMKIDAKDTTDTQ